MAATKETIENAIASSQDWAQGKVGFTIVGCVSYRASFEPPESRRHQTRFMYYLARIDKERYPNVLITPSGISPDLRLVSLPVGNDAD